MSRIKIQQRASPSFISVGRSQHCSDCVCGGCGGSDTQARCNKASTHLCHLATICFQIERLCVTVFIDRLWVDADRQVTLLDDVLEVFLRLLSLIHNGENRSFSAKPARERLKSHVCERKSFKISHTYRFWAILEAFPDLQKREEVLKSCVRY